VSGPWCAPLVKVHALKERAARTYQRGAGGACVAVPEEGYFELGAPLDLKTFVAAEPIKE
jgi:hypothetical protein